MVARIVKEPKSFLTDPTAVYDYDDPEIMRLVDEKPWLEWKQPIPVIQSLDSAGWPDSSVRSVILDEFEDSARVRELRIRLKEGRSLEGTWRQFKIVANRKLYDQPGYPDLFWIDSLKCCTRAAKDLIESFGAGYCEFDPLPVVDAKDNDWGTEIYQINVLARHDRVSFRSPKFEYTSRWNLAQFATDSHMIEYHCKPVAPLFINKWGVSPQVFASAEFISAFERAGLIANFGVCVSGWAFPDGTGYHPKYWPDWPPKPLPLPSGFLYPREGWDKLIEQDSCMSSDDVPAELLNIIIKNVS
ncbi:MAG: hypothetical protein Alpg2KO_10990 [Alphaproteobacteria bacterium]